LLKENKTANVSVIVTLRTFLATVVGVEKAINVTYSECIFVALLSRMKC